MTPTTDISSIRSPVSAEAPTPLASASAAVNIAQNAPNNLTQSAVGQVFQAQLLSQLEDGSFVVNVAENALRMSLPAGSTVGETMNMTLLATEPRPAFMLDQQGGSSTSASLSDAAKLINTALQTAQQSGAPTSLIGKTPIVASPETDVPQLTTALNDTIEFSGVFYESHVGQWASGDRPLSDLLLEPQVQAQETPPSQPSSSAPAAPPTNLRAPTDNTAAGTLLPRPPITEEQLTNQMANLANATRTAPDARPSLTQALSTLLSGSNLPKEADVLVREPTLTQANAQNINLQLNVLEQNRIVWQGELWPGQRMEWEINEDSSRGNHGDQDGRDQTVWQSVVRFDLPKLGKVSATLLLSDGHVRVHVNARSGDSATLLKAHGAELADALNAAGSPLDLLTVSQNEQV